LCPRVTLLDGFQGHHRLGVVTLAPLFEKDGQGKDRRWTFAGVLERLKGIRQETVVFNNTEVTLKTTPGDEQQRILDLLGVRL